jgi:hypothetical protein
VTASPGDVRQSTFVKIVVVALAVIVGLGFLIHFLNAGHHRPEGAAERWLAAVSDSGRKGVSVDARKRADDIGPITIAAPLLPDTHDTKHGLFADLEVGKAIAAGTDTVRVPFRLHQRMASGSGPLKQDTLVLHRTNDTWHVVALDGRRPGEHVPSEGGARPSRAPLALWLGAICLGVVLAALAHLITTYADRSARRATAAPGL